MTRTNGCVRVNLPDGSFWLYEYDSLGQVKSGKRYWSDWTPVAGQQFEYTHEGTPPRVFWRLRYLLHSPAGFGSCSSPSPAQGRLLSGVPWKPARQIAATENLDGRARNGRF